MARKTIKIWILDNLDTNIGLSVAELTVRSDGTYSFGQILTQLNRLLLDKTVVTSGENPIQWKKKSVISNDSLI